MNNPIISADKTPWYQWDTGLTVTVAAAKMDECHFANRKQGTAYVQAVINGIARVPDELLQVAAPIKAYGYVSDGAGGQTYIEETFEVIARNIPADYTYTKTAQKTIRDAEAARDEAVQAANDAEGSALAADDSAVEASNSAQSSGESASAAATSASNAAKSAGDAAKSASDAKTAADKAVEDVSAQLKTYTDNAKTSADNAATSASNAAASATAAAKSASDAAASVDAINVIAPKIVETAGAVSYGEYSIAIGQGSKSLAKKSIAIGKANVNNMYSTAIGYNAQCNGGSSDAIGNDALSIGNNSCSLGSKSSICATQGVAIGSGAMVIGSKLPDPNVKEFKASVVNSVAIGSFSTTDEKSVISVGNETESITEWKRLTDDSGNPTETAPYWGSETFLLPNNCRHLKRRIIHVADPIDWHNAANKNYVDTTTSNALVGTVSGKLLHVEDAWPSELLGLTVYGKSEQVTTTGINLWDIEHPTNLTDGESITKNSDGTYQAVTNTKNREAHYLVPVEAGATYYIRVKAPVFNGYGRHNTSVYDGETTDSKVLLNRVLIDENNKLRTFVPTSSTVLVSYMISSASVVAGGITIVEPMICKSASLVAWEPYSGGKPSPRIDFPQDINSIANVGVAVRGKNLLEYPYFDTTKEESGLTFTDNGDGTISISGTMTDPYYAEFKLTSMEQESGWSLPSGEYTLFCDAPEGVNILIVGVANGLEDRPIAAISSSGPGANIADFTVMDNEFIYVCLQMFNEEASNNGVVKVAIYAKSSNTYSPYVGTSLPITLPAEHPYLAALPNGTHDEILIDKDGNASLVARVGKTETAYTDGVSATVGNDALSSTGELADGATVYYKLATPVTYQLGKVTVPSLPETISNVWTDAELTTNMSMTYKQDVNVVIADLTAQIAALNGTAINDEPPEVTDTIVALS